ncbi:MAG: TrkA family potassium uptake protein [Acidimicrobiia bacterium]
MGLLLVIGVGGVGFVVIGHLAWGDAFYATMITISTLGSSEVGGPYDGWTRIWVVVVLVAGMGAALYTATAVVEYGFETVIGSDYRKRRKMTKEINRMENHVIVCGFGRVGSTAWKALDRDGIESVVIERDPEIAERAMALGASVVEGDATKDGVLLEAHAESAAAVIAAVASPSDNLVITLSVKSLHPDIAVAARAVDEETEKKLTLAGATAVVTPELVGGERMAALATEPALVGFLDAVASNSTMDFRIKRFTIAPDSPLVGRSLADLNLRADTGAMIIGVATGHTNVRINPDPRAPFEVGEVLYGLGSMSDLDKLSSIIDPSAR